MMSEVTKLLTLKDPVPQVGWLMFGKTYKYLLFTLYAPGPRGMPPSISRYRLIDND